jgi:hypothetical protein
LTRQEYVSWRVQQSCHAIAKKLDRPGPWFSKKEGKIMSSTGLIVLIVVLFLVFGGGGGYWYSRRGV